MSAARPSWRQLGTLLQGRRGRLALLGLLLAVSSALAVTAAYGATQLAWTVTNDLRGLLLRHTLELDLSFHGTHPPGELIERTDGNVTALSTLVSSFVMRIVGSAGNAPGGVQPPRHPGPRPPGHHPRPRPCGPAARMRMTTPGPRRDEAVPTWTSG